MTLIDSLELLEDDFVELIEKAFEYEINELEALGEDAISKFEFSLYFSVSITIAIVVAVCVYGIFLSKRIATPLLDLKEAASGIGKGDFFWKLDVSSQNEIGDLCRMFGQMSHQLQERTNALAVANEDLDQYASTVAHDMKAPLRAIHNYSEFLAEDLSEMLEGEQKKYLKNLLRAVRQGEELIDDLLKFSRIGYEEGHCEQVSLGTELASLIESFHLPSEVEVTLAPD